MIESFLQYGQWVILVLSILSLALVSSVKHETRLNGYILTGISRFAGALVFVFVDLPAGKSTKTNTKAPANLLIPVKIYPFSRVSCFTELTNAKLRILSTKITHCPYCKKLSITRAHFLLIQDYFFQQ